MEESRKRQVRERASNRCEYCLLPQEFHDLKFHIEHVVARQHREDDSIGNLALACDRCNLHKGTNLSSVDPETGDHVAIFSPRADAWNIHFAMIGSEIVGLTPCGRATVRLLNFNAERRLLLRRRLMDEGVY
jgi:hypothetical protein